MFAPHPVTTSRTRWPEVVGGEEADYSAASKSGISSSFPLQLQFIADEKTAGQRSVRKVQTPIAGRYKLAIEVDTAVILS